jgi:hypothetical protein
MCSLLLKKAIPFALTLVLGSFIGGLFKSVGIGGQKTEPARAYFDAYGEGHRHSCRMRYRDRDLVAETKPLVILSQPDALWPVGVKVEEGDASVPVNVTFGADGKVQKVKSARWYGPDDRPIESVQPVWDAVERAARQIQFEPETVNGLPVTVTRVVEINFNIE